MHTHFVAAINQATARNEEAAQHSGRDAEVQRAALSG